MIKQLRYYADRLRDIQNVIQDKLDSMELTDGNEELYNRREEQTSAIDDIISTLDDVINLIEDYNGQWRELKNLK